MYLAKNIRYLRRKNNFSQDYIAERLGYKSYTTIQKWEMGISEPSIKKLNELSDIFNIDINDITIKDLEAEEIYGVPLKSDLSRSVIRIPIFGKVPAGIPIEAIEDADWEDWEEIPVSWLTGDREYFGLKVNGNSMYPKYLDGDTIIVKKTTTCNSGDDCVIYVNGYDATLKTVFLKADTSIELRPINPEYSPRTYTPEEVAELPISICGTVVELRRKI